MNGGARARARGQVIVIFALAIIAIMAMTGLIIDGGNAFAQQRLTQNWTDGAAESGAVQLLRRLVGVDCPDASTPPPCGSDTTWNQRVVAAVNAHVTNDGLDAIGSINYTDINGDDIPGATTDVIAVSGVIPANAAGVHVTASRDFQTYISGAIGINQFTAAAESTYIAGYANGTGFGGLLPVTFPVLLTTCDNNNDLLNPGVPPDDVWPVGDPETGANQVIVPLCGNSPGNVGWIDWTPTAGGASELADAITPPLNNDAMSTPGWYYITATGNINSGQVQTALELWENQYVLLPIFFVDPTHPESDPLHWGTCNTEPAPPPVTDPPTDPKVTDCPDANRGGNGSNQWYFLVTFAEFYLSDVFITGGDGTECDPAGGNGATGCLKGYFTKDVVAANVKVGAASEFTEEFTPAGVQLIR